MAPKPFEAPKLKVARARNFIAELETEIASYLNRDPRALLLLHNKSSDKYTLGFCSREGIPREFSIIFGDAVHNLRAALDILANDLVALSGVDPKNVSFPFSHSSSGLGKQIKEKLRDASKDVKTRVRALKLYKGGNDALRAIHDLDIRDKHKALIEADTATMSPGMNLTFVEHKRTKTQGQITYRVDFATLPTIPIDTTGFSIEPGIEVIGKVAGSEVTVRIAKRLPLEKEPVIETLVNLADLVEGIIQQFETHCLGGKTI